MKRFACKAPTTVCLMACALAPVAAQRYTAKQDASTKISVHPCGRLLGRKLLDYDQGVLNGPLRSLKRLSYFAKEKTTILSRLLLAVL